MVPILRIRIFISEYFTSVIKSFCFEPTDHKTLCYFKHQGPEESRVISESSETSERNGWFIWSFHYISDATYPNNWIFYERVERKEISNEIKIFNGIPKKISKANLSQLLSEHVGRILLEILKEIKGDQNIISPKREKESVLAQEGFPTSPGNPCTLYAY